MRLVVRRGRGSLWFFHLAEDLGETAICGLRVTGQEEEIDLDEWGKETTLPNVRQWCRTCADRAGQLGLALARESLSDLERFPMNPVFPPELYARFPKLYADHLRPRAASPIWQRGIDVGSGWRGLIERLSAELEHLIGELPELDRSGVFATQVKEKWGTLVFRLESGTRAMYAAIEAAEEESRRTCARCGEPGRLRALRARVVLCKSCLLSPPKEALQRSSEEEIDAVLEDDERDDLGGGARGS